VRRDIFFCTNTNTNIKPMKTKTIKRNCPSNCPTALRRAVSGAVLLGAATSAFAQLPPNAVSQFQQVVGSRVEAATLLGGDYGVAGGVYSFHGGDQADLSIEKLGGGGIVMEPSSLGIGDMKWAPILQGNIGHLTAENHFNAGYLEGNRSSYDLTAVELGGGARFYFTDYFSLAPTVSGIYGYTENQFTPQNAVGNYVKSVASGTFVDWNMDTWSVVPSMDLNYVFHWRRTTFEFSSRYNYFHTESFNSSSPVVGVNGDSHTWANKLDVDVPLGWKLFDRELHTGGFFSRTELFGGAADGLNADHIYTVNGRLVMDMLGHVWKVQWLGVGCSYFWGDHFDGWSIGADVRFKF
jgi:hypothetical protein